MRSHRPGVFSSTSAIDAGAKQRGVALFAALIALVIIMLAAAALIRSTDISQAISGNLSIKRDITHESEIAVQAALAQFAVGGTLANEAARQANQTMGNFNYYATALASNAYGIPVNLVTVSSASGETAAGPGLTWRYVIDRMCPVTGAYDAANNACLIMQGNGRFTKSMDAHAPKIGSGASTNWVIVYRISIRVTDARGAQSYFQTTYGVPPV